MKLTDEEKMSKWAYEQCISGNDNEEMRNLITHPYWKFHYINMKCFGILEQKKKINIDIFGSN